jgi:hypothetical protein
VTVAAHSPLPLLTRLQTLAHAVLLLIQILQPQHYFGAAGDAGSALLFELADPRVVACAVGSSEPVARLAKSLERLSVLFHVSLDALDASDRTIDVTASSNVATRQRNGSCRQDWASPGDADPVKP